MAKQAKLFSSPISVLFLIFLFHGGRFPKESSSVHTADNITVMQAHLLFCLQFWGVESRWRPPSFISFIREYWVWKKPLSCVLNLYFLSVTTLIPNYSATTALLTFTNTIRTTCVIFFICKSQIIPSLPTWLTATV